MNEASRRESIPDRMFYDFCHSLTRGEKKYLIQHARTSKPEFFAKLMKHICNQQIFDENFFSEFFSTETLLPEHLFLTRQQQQDDLFYFMLISLRGYVSTTEGISVEKEIKNSLLDIDFLMEKHFYKEATKKIAKVKISAIKYDCIVDMLRILDLEMQIIIAELPYYSKKVKIDQQKKLEQLGEEAAYYLKRLREQMHTIHEDLLGRRTTSLF